MRTNGHEWLLWAAFTVGGFLTFVGGGFHLLMLYAFASMARVPPPPEKVIARLVTEAWPYTLPLAFATWFGLEVMVAGVGGAVLTLARELASRWRGPAGSGRGGSGAVAGRRGAAICTTRPTLP